MRKMKHTACGALALLLAAGCAKKADSPDSAPAVSVSPQTGDAAQKPSSAQLNSEMNVAQVARGKVDSAKLITYGVSVADQILFGVAVGSANWSVNGEADYVELEICNQVDHTCKPVEKTNALRFDVMPFGSMGDLELHVKACVQPERALVPGANCGEPYVATYTQKDNPNAKRLALLADERQSYVKALGQYALDGKKILQAFADESKSCQMAEQDRQKILAIRGLVLNYLALGEDWIQRGAMVGPISLFDLFKSNPAGGSPSPTATAAAKKMDLGAVNNVPGTKLNDPLADAQARFQQFSDYNDVVVQIAKSLGYFKASEPTNAVNMLGSAVFDLFTAKRQVKVACEAKNKADFAMAALQTKIATANLQIDTLNKQIVALGGR